MMADRGSQGSPLHSEGQSQEFWAAGPRGRKAARRTGSDEDGTP
jgi:hypothetical protein